MLKVPPGIATQFERRLEARAITPRERGGYRKWLRYYLDFCHKYRFSDALHGKPILRRRMGLIHRLGA